MSFNLWDFLFYHLPVWLQLTILAIPVAVAFWFAIQVFGWEKVRGWILPVLGVLAALGLLSRSRQQGYADRKVEEGIAEKKAETVVDKTRTDVQALPDDQLDEKVDKWSRH